LESPQGNSDHAPVDFLGGKVWFANESMKPIQGCHLIKPEDLIWRTSNLMHIPNADKLSGAHQGHFRLRWKNKPFSGNNYLNDC
jgi:hypothetical protein